jgi:single-strand DNA-binding protein
MPSLNKWEIIGHLGSEPEMRFTPSGAPVTSFNIATNYGYGERKETVWARVTCWNKQAEFANQYGNKGSLARVEGEVRMTSYETKDGETRYNLELTAREIMFLDKRKQETIEETNESEDSF